jgi:23S rRNA (uracil1939-C5)-methyltransferase
MYKLLIESLDHEGHGVAHHEGKAIFVHGALPGEVVEASPYRKKSSFELAKLDRVLKPSAMRVDPQCGYFGTCGGCSLQHVDARAQVAAKQRVLEDNLWHIGKVSAEQILPAIYGPSWGYRHRARFSVRHVVKKGGTLVGFRERRGSYVTDMRSCEVMPQRISALLPHLQEVLGRLSICGRVPQVEVALGEAVDVLVLRILLPLSADDEALLRKFSERHAVQLYLQPKGPDSAFAFHPATKVDLYYTLPEFELKINFTPTDFTQVNPEVNRVLMRRALMLLAPLPGEHIADMFCGIGNFSLAIARRGASVTGLEGSATLVGRASENAAANGLADSTRFMKMDLFKINSDALEALGRFDRMLIDPPRDGAVELVKAIENNAPARIVYVSCNPATLARDAGMLVLTKGYRLSSVGVINMFPHTSHVESIAVFDRAT